MSTSAPAPAYTAQELRPEKEAGMTTAHTAGPGTRHARDDLLSLSEVADLVRVPVATLRYWRHLGTGPHSFKVGRSVRYWRTDVLRWLEERSTDAHGTP